MTKMAAKWLKLIPSLWPKAHTYIAHIREYPTPRDSYPLNHVTRLHYCLYIYTIQSHLRRAKFSIMDNLLIPCSQRWTNHRKTNNIRRRHFRIHFFTLEKLTAIQTVFPWFSWWACITFLWKAWIKKIEYSVLNPSICYLLRFAE